jgi:DNA-binding CsgD family transcriptional regulator
MPAEEWRSELARRVAEATGAEFATIATNQPGLWQLQHSTFPRAFRPFIDEFDSSIRPRTENTPDEWHRAMARLGPVHAPLDHAHDLALAHEAHQVLWRMTRARGLIVAFLTDERMRLFGVMALGARNGAPLLLDREGGSLRELVSVAAGTLRGAIDLAQACGLSLPASFPGIDELSPREREVARLAADGLTSLAIGARLGIREATVSVHLHRIYAKLGIGSRVQLALLVRGATCWR